MTLALDIRHAFPGFQLEARFHARPGVTALMGRSGAGKSSIVKAVTGLIRPDHGVITLGERVLFDSGRAIAMPPHRRRIGTMFQEPRLFPHLSVRSNLTYGRWFARRRGADGPSFDQVVTLLGLGALLARGPAALSGGEAARVALGRALLSSPDLLVMDEPLAALDEARRQEILPFLEALRDEIRLPILHVSHNPAEVARLASRVVVIEAGRVIADGPLDEVSALPALAVPLGARGLAGLIEGRLEGIEPDGLWRIATAFGPLLLPAPPAPSTSAPLRLRIPARDVMLAAGHVRPPGMSALNIWPARVAEIAPLQSGPGLVLVRLSPVDSAAKAHLSALISTRSAEAMALTPGAAVQAIIKSAGLADGRGLEG